MKTYYIDEEDLYENEIEKVTDVSIMSQELESRTLPNSSKDLSSGQGNNVASIRLDE